MLSWRKIAEEIRDAAEEREAELEANPPPTVIRNVTRICSCGDPACTADESADDD